MPNYFADDILFRTGSGTYINGLTKTLQEASLGRMQWQGTPSSVVPLFTPSQLDQWPSDQAHALLLALKEVLAWPLPGSEEAHGFGWGEYAETEKYGQVYRKATPAARKIYVMSARTHISDAVTV